MTLSFSSPMPDVQALIDAAYQRGREDAVEAIERLHQKQNDGTCSCNGFSYYFADEVLMKNEFRYPCPTLIAARGGEQA